MKARLPILLSWLLLLLAACDGGRRQQMEADLERLQAWNVADSMLTNDSLAQSLVDYFDRHGTPNERLLAHYLLGRTYADKGDAPRALDAYYEAIEVADTTAADTDYGLLARAHAQMADLFYWQNMPDVALSEFDFAYDMALKNKERQVAIVFYEHRAKCFNDLGMKDSAIAVVRQTYSMYTQQGDTISANTCLGNLIQLYIDKKDFEKTKELLRLYEFHSLLNEDAIKKYEHWKLLYVYKGEYFLGIHQKDSAIYYFKKVLSESSDVNNQAIAYKGLFDASKQFSLSDSLSIYAEAYVSMNDSSTRLSISKNMQQMKALYDYNKYKEIAARKTQEASLAEAKLLLMFVAIILLSVFFVLFIIYFQVRKKRTIQQINMRYASDIVLYHKTLSELQVLEKQQAKDAKFREQLEKQLIFLKESIASAQEDNAEPEEWNLERSLLETSIVTKFHQKAAQGKTVSNSDWGELRLAVNTFMPMFMERLQGLAYQPNLQETELCILIKLRFLLSEIGCLINKKPSALTNMRQRLYTKMFGLNGTASEFDDKIRQLGE